MYDAVGASHPFEGARTEADRTLLDLSLQGGKVYVLHFAREPESGLGD